MRTSSLLSLIAICMAAGPVSAQPVPRSAQPAAAREDALDLAPIDPAVDPDIDLYINNWKNSQSRALYGHLAVRDILTRLDGPDPLHPRTKGAVLTNITAISYAMLEPGAIAGGKAQ